MSESLEQRALRIAKEMGLTWSRSDDFIIEFARRLLAEQQKQEPETIERREKEWRDLAAAVAEYADGYEFGDDSTYSPTEDERLMLVDFFNGLMAEDSVLSVLAKVYPIRTRNDVPVAKAQDALDAKRLDAERMRMAGALREILDYPLDSDVIHAAAQMKLIAVRAFIKPLDAAIDAAMSKEQTK